MASFTLLGWKVSKTRNAERHSPCNDLNNELIKRGKADFILEKTVSVPNVDICKQSRWMTKA
jgi:hypothetical protein